MKQLIDINNLNNRASATNAETVERVISISIDDIKPSIENFYSIDKTELELLKESIRENGQLDPLLLTDDFEIISGHRRFEAMKQLNFIEIQAIVKRVNSELEKKILLVEANRYRNKSAEDKQKEIEIAIELVKERKKSDPNFKGRTASLAAEMLGISAATVKRIQKKVKENKVGSNEPKKQKYNTTLKINLDNMDDVVRVENFLNQFGYDFELQTKLKE